MTKEEKIIKTTDKVVIVGTGRYDGLAEGKELSVHPEVAKKMIAEGKAKAKTGKKLNNDNQRDIFPRSNKD